MAFKFKEPPKVSDVACIVHVNAGNDGNGNPRRAYVAFGNKGYVGMIFAWIEGYAGRGIVPDKYQKKISIGSRLDITPKQYRELKSMANETYSDI